MNAGSPAPGSSARPRAAGRAVAFLTPLGRPGVPTPAALLWFPVVGALVGAAVGTVWWAAARVWPPLLAAAVALAADLALTGMLHLDGLADSADGLLPHLERPRRLEVMAAPDVGAFGVSVAAVTLLLRLAALAALAPSVLLIAALWCLSRTAMALVALTQPYARAATGGGLASAFLGRGPRAGVVAAAGGGGALLLAWSWGPVPGLAAVAAAAAAALGVAALARRRLGGFTGDVLGAAGVVAETVGLIVAAARW